MALPIGVLLINLGSPESPSARDVGRYLCEFLMDPLVMDIPYVFRWCLVNGVIVPRRSKSSSALYKKVWSDAGSPLIKNTLDLVYKVQKDLGEKYRVLGAMRYGKPSIQEAFETLRQESIRDVIALPLYPQYSLAATESSLREIEKHSRGFSVKALPPFYSEDFFLDSFAEVGRPYIERGDFDKVLFSFHGLPERQIKKTDLEGNYCFIKQNCCLEMDERNQNCYRAQCYKTAVGIALRLGLKTTDYLVCFQSRMAGTPWIQPYTDHYYRTLPKEGVKRLLVFCPSFVSDCLETLEEVSIRGNAEFLQHGGERVELVPSLNASEGWARALSRWIPLA